MGSQKLTYILCFLFLLATSIIIGGCAKEYSYEAGLMPDSTLVKDTTNLQDSTTPAAIIFPNCIACSFQDTIPALKWNFKIGGSALCGNVTNAVISPGRDALTFFGPSACSGDSGLVITAYFNEQILDKDQSNINATRAVFVYYDNTSNSDLLQSKQPFFLSLAISSYVQQTGIAKGTFSGYVFDRNGQVVKVDAGAFTIILK